VNRLKLHKTSSETIRENFLISEIFLEIYISRFHFEIEWESDFGSHYIVMQCSF